MKFNFVTDGQVFKITDGKFETLRGKHFFLPAREIIDRDWNSENIFGN